MEAFEIALLSVVAMLVFIYLGMHIAVTLALVSFVGAWIIKGSTVVAVNLLWISAHQTVNSFVFAVIPLIGIGFLLQQNINLRNYRAASAQIFAIAIVVSLMDYVSSALRQRAI